MKTSLRMIATGGLLVAAVATLAGAQGTTDGADLTAAGATFPYPIYSKWFADYAAKTGVKINYQPIGSGGGIRQLQEQTVDFGASDAPMSDDEMSRAKGSAVLHFPTVLGAVVLTYNVPGVAKPLRLTGDVIGEIFLGQITKWNDAKLTALNPGVKLPAMDVLVVHRSDGSGTTYIFTDYLTAASSAWASGPGKGKDVKWPVGLGRQGQRRCDGAGETDAGRDRLRRARICEAEQAAVCRGEERGGTVRNTDDRERDRGGRRCGEGPPTHDGLPRVDRKRAGA